MRIAGRYVERKEEVVLFYYYSKKKLLILVSLFFVFIIYPYAKPNSANGSRLASFLFRVKKKQTVYSI